MLICSWLFHVHWYQLLYIQQAGMFNQTQGTVRQEHVFCQLPFINSSVLFLKMPILVRLWTGIDYLGASPARGF